MSAPVHKKQRRMIESRAPFLLETLQPGDEQWDGHGVARPSVFVPLGAEFAQKFAAVQSDKGGPGSWLWKKVPVSQGAARPVGGAAAVLAERMREAQAQAQALAAARAVEAQAAGRARRRAERLKALADEWRSKAPEKQPLASGASARQDAIDAYRRLNMQRGRRG